MIVVADTSPLNYLVLIGYADLLPLLYTEIVISSAVRTELLDPKTPSAVRDWVVNPPQWFVVRAASQEHLRPTDLN